VLIGSGGRDLVADVLLGIDRSSESVLTETTSNFTDLTGQRRGRSPPGRARTSMLFKSS